MVRETKTLGQGDVGVPEPRHLPTVRNIVVYGKKKMMKVAINHIPVPKMHTLIHRRDILLFPCSIFADSSRQVENWELMWVAQQVCDTDDLHYWLLTCE